MDLDDDEFVRMLRERYGDQAVDEQLEKSRRLKRALDENFRARAGQWDETYCAERERWDEGLALEAKQQRQKSALGRFEVWREEIIEDGFGGVVRRLRRHFLPPANF